MKCAICPQEFELVGKGSTKKLYCSRHCRMKARYLRRRAEIESRPGFVIVPCATCDNFFERSTRRGGVRLYCGDDCKRIAGKAIKYGMNPRHLYKQIIEQQECPGCLKHETELGVMGFVQDHDHKCCGPNVRPCGRCNRGRLCNKCNSVIGYAEDDVNTLKRLIQYLDFYRDQQKENDE